MCSSIYRQLYKIHLTWPKALNLYSISHLQPLPLLLHPSYAIDNHTPNTKFLLSGEQSHSDKANVLMYCCTDLILVLQLLPSIIHQW